MIWLEGLYTVCSIIRTDVTEITGNKGGEAISMPPK